MKLIKLIYLSVVVTAFAFVACDDDTFSTSSSLSLTFSTDTIKLDTIFSTMPSSTQSMWVYNKSGDGLRCTSVQLEKGNQTGFRVNVDGSYLGATTGYAINDVELRKKDSIRVFVEATLPNNHNSAPTLVEDNLVFTLESGKQQKINLRAFSWDARIISNLLVESDYTLAYDGTPIIIRGGITVGEGATLTIQPGTTLYFSSNAGIDVHGRLVCNGTANSNITLRGERLDRMFDYLPYDRVSGQWNGIHLYESSYDNVLDFTDIHSTFDGIVADSSDVDRTKLTIANSIVHNCQGYAIRSVNSKLSISNCQLTNTLNDCLFVDGGIADINNTTMAQFYPFDSNRGYALHASSVAHPLTRLDCKNSIVTGYADDLLMINYDETSENACEFAFSHSILRTPKVETEDSVKFTSVIFEDVEDTTACGKKHFVLIDGDNQAYDFRLSAKSKAIGIGDATTAMPTDRLGTRRDDQPDAGAYEYVEQ